MITKIEILPNDLHVHFSRENSEVFPNIWLRDHAKDEQIGTKGLVKERLLQHL